ncbi:MAG TPA: PP2C family serine/threonine-protein phosphatase [Pyrinomonadaceae bacterium]|nr:PP2C family serine/threonine-protein phosphatase [Pyrinomonadaceae bacterium]
MTENPAAVPVETASVTDRGLSEKRPLNEDSMLSDPERRIFAVADGVGGAQAGEVASQTAIEVLGEAFTHRDTGEDVEDLMEIAIQRANDSIYRLSREQPRFAMMATTIVALHLDGLRATIGHVGDSRLYRLTPDGHLRRETEDHSLVEEEVRAGRMTPEQAANHPGRNVISRALGAEEAVEVDMKTVEVESGSIFLLCSDGITRHIPDPELSSLIRHAQSLASACEEMKRVCYERGAEDNLTAVLVRVGGAVDFPDEDDEVTLVREREALHNAPTLPEKPSPLLHRPLDGAGADERTAASARVERNATAGNLSKDKKVAANSGGGALRGVGVLFLVLAAVALAFYVGMMFDRKGMKRLASAAATPPPSASPTAAALEDPEARFDRLRRAVDLSPTSEAIRMTAESNNQPLNSDDPEFLYLYGRAMLLTDRQQEAATAFDRAIQKINENMTPRNGELMIDAGLAKVAAQMRGGDVAAARVAANDLGQVIRPQQSEANANANSASNSNASAQPSPGASP